MRALSWLRPSVLAPQPRVCPSNADDGVACVPESLANRLDPLAWGLAGISQVIRRLVPGLIETDLAATGNVDAGYQAEPGLPDRSGELRAPRG